MNAPVKIDPKTDAKSTKTTPMMAQFLGIKEGVGPDILLFYRMGDFYELFFEDAVLAAAALDIALTKRGKHNGADIPMCGVPVHASETYLQRLIKKGFRVAVCEQTESPAEAKKRGYKSVVRREVVRVVTPGTLTEDSLLDARGANYILSLARTPAGDHALAWADISTGGFWTCAVEAQRLPSEIAALSPRELILAENLYQTPDFMATLPFDLHSAALTPLAGSKFDPRAGERRLKDRFDVASLDGFGAFSKAEVSAAGGLLDYLELTQAGGTVELSPPQRRVASGFMAIDPATRSSLEIDRTQKGTKQGSLLSVVDKTVTGPGARLLSARLNRPLVDVAAINARLDAVSFFADDHAVRNHIRTQLKSTGDLARAISRLALGRGGPRDLLTIGAGLSLGQQLCTDLEGRADIPSKTRGALGALRLDQHTELQRLADDIKTAFKDDVPMMSRDGGFVAPGWHEGLDELRQLRDDSRKIIAGLQASYAAETDVPTLKIKHNNVLGYFIEVSPKYGDAMLALGTDSPYIHRQTLVSGVRFTTTELAELDAKISGAGDKALRLELEIFEGFVQSAKVLAEDIRAAGHAFAVLDVQAALAEWAEESQACRPVIDESTAFTIDGGQHPVVTAALRKSGTAGFTPNDCRLDASGKAAPRLTLITGPNMAGKSTYLRQNAVMFILAQAGGFVPARNAHIGIADSLFSRVGASDDLSQGRSTFMTEMIETAAILNQAGPRSFVILDEIGRGTATFDGLSIAWATTEHLHAVNKSRALFATHYHELTDLAENLDAASNASLRAKEWDGDLVFLHDVQPGAADKSYGVQVAKLAGLPPAAVTRARAVLDKLEKDQDGTPDALGALPLFTSAPPPAPRKPSAVEIALSDMDVDTLSPRAALDVLYELKAKLK
ncbi:MAG: DNA mismatch repair protein MutS [Maricaulaceae bacterium]